MLSLQTNITADSVLAAYHRAEAEQLRSVGRLASGRARSTAGEGAAELGITNRMTAAAVSFRRRVDNAHQAINALELGSSTLEGLNQRLQRMRELAVEAASGAQTDLERAALQTEYHGLLADAKGVLEKAEWNGTRFLQGLVDSSGETTLSFSTGESGTERILLDFAAAAGSDLQRSENTVSGNRLVEGVDASAGSSGSSATTEVQNLSVADADIQDSTVSLTVGSTVLSSGSLGASATLDDLVTGLQSDADYSGAAFTLAKNGSSGLTLTWKSSGSVSDIGLLDITPDSSTTNATQAVAGASDGYQSETYTLSAADSHFSGATQWGLATSGGNKIALGNANFDGTVSDLISSINSSTAAAYVTASATASGATFTWNTTGSQDSLNLYIYNPTDGLFSVVYTGTATTPSVATAEVQEFSLTASDIQDADISLTFNGSTYTAASLSSTASMADLVSALNTAAAAAPFTVEEITAANSNASTAYTSGVRLTWNTTGTVNGLASLVNSGGTASSVTASRTVTGSAAVASSSGAGATEIQAVAFSLPTSEGSSYRLDVGTVSLSAEDMSSDASAADLLARLQSDSDYANADFTLALGDTQTLTLTWKSQQSVTDQVSLTTESYRTGEPALKGLMDSHLNSADAAQSSIVTLDASLDLISRAQSAIGAAQQRLSSLEAWLSNSYQLSMASMSKIADTDYSKEVLTLTRAQIVRNASQAMLAQANQSPQGVIGLLSQLPTRSAYF